MKYQVMKCKDCKYYESYHQYPNPNAVAKHYCTKCNEEIEYIRTNYDSDVYAVWLPKGCYFNDCFEFSDKFLKRQKEKYTTGLLGCQIED